jgi:hypothetical protein
MCMHGKQRFKWPLLLAAYNDLRSDRPCEGSAERKVMKLPVNSLKQHDYMLVQVVSMFFQLVNSGENCGFGTHKQFIAHVHTYTHKCDLQRIQS